MARPATDATPAIRAVQWNVLRSPVGGNAAIPASSAFATRLRACGCGLSSLALEAQRPTRRLQHFDQPPRQRIGPRITPGAAEILHVVQSAEDVRPLPGRESHALLLSVDRMIGFNFEGDRV